MTLKEFEETINQWAHEGIPFLFIVDFELEKPIALKLNEVDPSVIQFYCNGLSNYIPVNVERKSVHWDKLPIPFLDYLRKFNIIYKGLERGDSYLTNLTVKTILQGDFSLEQIFRASSAKYKLMIKDQFVVFSPESFVKIEEGKIYSFPMKGTIDASIKDAQTVILSDKKELAEHVTIVDLIRNDLSSIASNVNVKRFRYIDELVTNHKTLLQVSSEIVGDLSVDYKQQLGSILLKLLPAGSISGAPKKKTVEMIQEAEQEKRGYYTGVFGIYDGNRLDSGVMIRFIEKTPDGHFYRSGGGITTQSIPENEYQEVIDKVYVPFN